MPAGDPAGYLPSVKRARRRKGQPTYQPRAKRGGMKAIKASTGGATAPEFLPKTGFLGGRTDTAPMPAHRGKFLLPARARKNKRRSMF